MPDTLEYHPNDDERTWGNPPCITLGECVVCTFPVYSSNDDEMPDAKRHALARMFVAAPALLAACKELMEAGVGPEWPEVASRLWDMALSKAEAAIALAEKVP